MDKLLWVFAILGVIALFGVWNLQTRVSKLERQLANVEGTPANKEKKDLTNVVKGYVGRNVVLEFRDDECDMDLVNCAARKGSCTILEADDDWVLVHIVFDKTDKEKLFRMESITGITIRKKSN